MLLPHVARHPVRYLGTWIAESGVRLTLGRLTEAGPCIVWLDEGGVHFDRGHGNAMLLPRRCLIQARTVRHRLRRVLEIWWRGADNAIWISRFTAQKGVDWEKAVEGLLRGTQIWNSLSADPE